MGHSIPNEIDVPMVIARLPEQYIGSTVLGHEGEEGKEKSEFSSLILSLIAVPFRGCNKKQQP